MGLIVSTILNVWIGIGATLYPSPVPTKPLTIEGCTALTTLDYSTIFTTLAASTVVTNAPTATSSSLG